MLPPLWQALKDAVDQTPLSTTSLRLIPAAGLTLDASAQRWSPEIAKAAQAILDANQFLERRNALLNGDIANPTEHRAAWHTELRAAAPIREVADERERMINFVRLADAERRWRNIIHIGIGGSDWGVRLAIGAFGYAGTWRNIRFASNIDGHAMAGAIAGLDPRETLIIVASKSFTTTETLENAARAMEWLKNTGITNPYQQMVAITAHADRAIALGIPENQIFKVWDWVGGRFSLWSSVALTIALGVGIETVAGLHAGAAAMDQHFATTPIEANAPIQMAIAGVINRSLLGYGSLNIAPYDFRLGALVPYLQQLEMESLGKSVDINGQPVALPTGPTLWGMPGTDAQHTYFQWLHQSSDGAPVDFIMCEKANHKWPTHHKQLLANCLAQREAMLKGKTLTDAYEEGLANGLTPSEAQQLAPHRVHPGGRPSNLIVLPRLTPYTLGALLALYEHKVFTQGVLWNINPFDQWGVEYGKQIVGGIIARWFYERNSSEQKPHDASTTYWVHKNKN